MRQCSAPKAVRSGWTIWPSSSSRYMILKFPAVRKTTPESYLSYVALMTNTDLDLSAGKDAVKFMTVHTAKGLEFPYVFHLRDSMKPYFPSKKTANARGDGGRTAPWRSWLLRGRKNRTFFIVTPKAAITTAHTGIPRVLFSMLIPSAFNVHE